MLFEACLTDIERYTKFDQLPPAAGWPSGEGGRWLCASRYACKLLGARKSVTSCLQPQAGPLAREANSYALGSMPHRYERYTKFDQLPSAAG